MIALGLPDWISECFGGTWVFANPFWVSVVSITPLYQIRSLYGPAELEVPESNLKQIPADNACASVELCTDETQKPFLLSLHANLVTSKDLNQEKAKKLTNAFVLLAQQIVAE